MNAHLHERLARERLDEARARAAQAAMVRSLRGALGAARRPVRLTIGLVLIRVGRRVAGRAPTRTAGPRRATA